MSNKKKILIIILALLFISPFFYKYYLYYQIPYNPLLEFSIEPITSSYTKYNPNESGSFATQRNNNFKSNDDLTACSDIFKYLKSLKLKPLKKNNLDFEKINYEYYLRLSSPEDNEIMIFISTEDLTNIYIATRKVGLRDGHYKVIDEEFDYEYVNNLIDGNK